MIAPGAVFSSGRLDITASSGQVPDSFVQGIGVMADGSVAIDTAVPAGAVFNGGFRQSAAGALYGTTTAAGTDTWVNGVRISNVGQIVYEAAAATDAQNGNPTTSNGRLATI